MKLINRLVVILVVVAMYHVSKAQPKLDNTFKVPYGDNIEAGNYVTINGAKLYYEAYGKGEPLLLIHGNSGEINSMDNQIDYFKTKYRVIVADNRGHGKSELKSDSLTYSQIAKDWEGLVHHLKLDSVNVVGWSDGGIIALKMGIASNCKIKKIVAMGANLRPDTTAVHSWAVNEAKKTLEFIESKIQQKDTLQPWKLGKQVIGLLVHQPTIEPNELSKINAKVLVVAGDKDIIKNKHTVEIFENIPQAQLYIMPGETHYTPKENPELFNQLVADFLSKPFVRPESDFTKRKK